MTTNLSISGKISGVLHKQYDGKASVYLQFIMESESRGLEVIKVKMTQAEDASKMEKGLTVAIPVAVSVMNNVLYFTQNDTVKVLNREQK